MLHESSDKIWNIMSSKIRFHISNRDGAGGSPPDGEHRYIQIGMACCKQLGVIVELYDLIN